MKSQSSRRLLIASAIALLGGGSLFGQIDNFDSLNGYAAGVESRLSRSHLDLTDLRSPRAGWMVSVEGQFISRDISPAEDRLQREADAQQFGLNAGWGRDNWMIGGMLTTNAFTNDYLEIDSPAPVPTNGKIESDTVSMGLWFVSRFEKLVLDANLAFGSTDYDGVRNSDLGTSTADFDGSDTFGFVRLAYEFDATTAIRITPYVGIGWSDVEADGFTEQGSAFDRRIVGDFSTSESNLVVGVSISGSQGDWKPALSLGYFSELSSDPASLSIQAINGIDLGSGVVPNASEELFYVGAQLVGELEDNWRLRGAIDYFSGGDEEQTGFTISVSKGW